MWRNAELEKPSYPDEVLCYVESKNFYTDKKAYYYMIGCYIPKLTAEQSLWYDDGIDCDYSEEDDCFYYPEGWVEKVHNWEDFGFIYLEPSDTVLYWQPTSEFGITEIEKENENVVSD